MTGPTTEKQKAQLKLGLMQCLTVENARALLYISVALRNFGEFIRLFFGN